jgi:DNA-binding SARP family transcriptional activator
VVAARPSGADPPPEATCPSTRRLAVRCFGRFEITVDGRPVDLSGVAPRNLELLALLTVHAGRPVHRDRLTGLIWPEAAGAQANHSLQVAVSALRGLLEPTVPRGQRGLLRREGQGYLLSLADPDDHDLRRFERLLEAAGAARRARDSEREHDLLVPAIELYAGEVVPAVGPTDWLVAERERLRVSAAAACERAAGICAAADRHADAVRHAERGLELDRYQDGLWRVLVRALRSAGQPAAASRAEVRYAGMLAELGIDDARAGGPQPARPERRA